MIEISCHLTCSVWEQRERSVTLCISGFLMKRQTLGKIQERSGGNGALLPRRWSEQIICISGIIIASEPGIRVRSPCYLLKNGNTQLPRHLRPPPFPLLHASMLDREDARIFCSIRGLTCATRLALSLSARFVHWRASNRKIHRIG